MALSQQKDVRIVEFTNSKIIDELNIAEIGQALTAIIDQSPNPKLLLDFGQVEHLSSAALGMLINANGRIKSKNGQLRLCNIKPQIYEVFLITKLNKLFYIHPTRQEALASFT
ncbi:MAG TPA: STAS domain-containing protein [Tepidisphaeraceae bacterium]|nr:STAS domain-containing protein [Tepidisphaeraceae bacterium]